MHLIKMAIFDMAGTTVNEGLLVYKSLHKIIAENGFNIKFEDVMRISAGKEKKKAIDEIFFDTLISNETKIKIFNQFSEDLEYVYQNMPVKEQFAASEIFKYLRLKNIKVVLNTGYERNQAEKLLELLDWKIGHQIDDLITASDVKVSRPAPDMIFLAMQRNNIDNPNEIAKIGDTTYDIEEGINAGCIYNFGVLTGAHDKDMLESANPFAVINDLNELKRYF
jgi:phosphonatase-like hydrolase